MKKMIIGLIAIILITISIAYAEPVTEMQYILKVDNETRKGVYTGNIEAGVPAGYGIFETVNPNGYKWHYIGNWVNGTMHGSGAIYWEDGSLEIGEYNNGHFVSGIYNYDGLNMAVLEKDTGGESEKQQEENEIYIGNKGSGIFHRHDCEYAEKMREYNRVEIETRQDAVNLGYTPCRRCQP